MEGCHGQSFHTIGCSSVTWSHIAARKVRNAFRLLVWEEKELAVYAADISYFPMFQQILTPPKKDTVCISALICSAPGWMYDRHKFRHTGTPDFCCDWGAYSFLMETNKGTCSPMETIPRWKVGWGHCLRDCSQHLKVRPEMETDKPVFGQSWLLNQAFPEGLSSFPEERVIFLCLIQFVLWFLFLKICSLPDALLSDTIPQGLCKCILFKWLCLGNYLIAEMGSFLI